MNNDMLHFAMMRACRVYGSKDMFTNATLSHALKKISGVKRLLDGEMVRTLLVGRTDVVVLSGGCHYRLMR